MSGGYDAAASASAALKGLAEAKQDLAIKEFEIGTLHHQVYPPSGEGHRIL
jgi:hypothetical protein